MNLPKIENTPQNAWRIGRILAFSPEDEISRVMKSVIYCLQQKYVYDLDD